MDCPLCSTACLDTDDLKRHLKIAHKASSNSQNLLKCSRCSFQTDKQYFLRRHHFSCHVDADRSRSRGSKRSSSAWRGHSTVRQGSPDFHSQDVLELHPSPHKWEDIQAPSPAKRIVRDPTSSKTKPRLQIEFSNASATMSSQEAPTHRHSPAVTSATVTSHTEPKALNDKTTLTLTMKLEVSTGEQGEFAFNLTDFKLTQPKPATFPEDQIKLGTMKLQKTAEDDPVKEE